ncbi:uncharacterized protein A4U43_C08F2280 [Asparagus officinalis]|uniref:uncharacterized protein LOC109822480 n=1 Tax=Asparagus officinalis TaxID=4686 RepID=UPI00098E5C1A|nr:uncharacterized protein LOC109822480 [Asparagus officinalis]ONK59033.1 uncharacterized protein A4U43_C08F2280 [Asparagus officinalis]
MSSEIEDKVFLPESQKSSRVSYSRDFLLSLSQLEACKKLPSGFHPSFLSELGDDSSSGIDRQRNLGTYVRRNQGRWDSQSSGSSDKDGDLQSDRDTVDSDRQFARRYQQNSEHDGLLGSGAFPRPTGYSAGKARVNGPYQLNRSTEPYQPPRPYKAIPYSRKDNTDSYNDETFGSSECSGEDRAEEEKKRRESFELMRKEQHKALQQKHKQGLDNHKENLDTDISALLANSADENSMSKSKSDEPGIASLSRTNSSSSSLHIQAPASRPPVPPGFRSSLVDKNLSVQCSTTSLTSEGNTIIGSKHSLNIMDNNQDNICIPAASTPVNLGESAPKVSYQLSIDANEKRTVPIIGAEVLKPSADFEKTSSNAAVQEASQVWEDDFVIMNDSSCKKGPTCERINAVNQDSTTTILEKLFSSALSKNYASSPNSLEHQGVKADKEKWDPVLSESSMSAHWFSENEKKFEDFSSRELLSLIVSNEKSGSLVSTADEKAGQNIPLKLTSESVVNPSKLPTIPVTCSVTSVPENCSLSDKKSPNSTVLTCEDLEQSILAEVKITKPDQHHSDQGGWIPADGKSERMKAVIDDRASNHLLSLLQNRTGLENSISSCPLGIESADSFCGSKVKPLFDHISGNTAVKIPEKVSSSEKTLTLEALFGASFMNALHSAEAPVSAQRGSVDTVNNTEVMQPHGVSLVEAVKPADMGTEEEEAGEIQLPEEDSLITVSDTVNAVTTDPFSFNNVHKPEVFLPENNNVENNDKFINAIFRDKERLRKHVSDVPVHLQKEPLKMVDPSDLYRQLHGRPSSHFPHQIDQSRPLFPPLDHPFHINPQMKLAGQNGMHHDPHLPFHENLIPRQDFNHAGAPRVDPAAFHYSMLQNMPAPANFHPHHPMQSLPRGLPPSYPMNHTPGYMHEMNTMHNFSLHNRQPDYNGGPAMGLRGPVVGGGVGAHPEALERLIQMEMRANSKHLQPPVGHHIPGVYEPENINFRYR